MNGMEIVLTLFLVSMSFYLIGKLISPKGKRIKDKFDPFTGGEILPRIRPKYFSKLYEVILLFLMLDAIILIVATIPLETKVYVGIYLSVLALMSLLVGYKMRIRQ